MPTPTHGVEHRIHTGSHPPSFGKIPSPGSRKTRNCKSGIQTFGIHRHWSPFQITIGGSCSQTCWYLHHHSRSSQEFAWELLFSYPAGRFLHAPGSQLLRSLHKSGLSIATGNYLRGSTSDLVRSSPKAIARGGTLWGLPMPLVHGYTQHRCSTMYSSTVVHCVQSLYINHHVCSNKLVLS
jgi:hypothetical protein